MFSREFGDFSDGLAGAYKSYDTLSCIARQNPTAEAGTLNYPTLDLNPKPQPLNPNPTLDPKPQTIWEFLKTSLRWRIAKLWILRFLEAKIQGSPSCGNVERERERERQRDMCIYIYVCVYRCREIHREREREIYIYIYIYTYIYTEAPHVQVPIYEDLRCQAPFS